MVASHGGKKVDTGMRLLWGSTPGFGVKKTQRVIARQVAQPRCQNVGSSSVTPHLPKPTQKRFASADVIWKSRTSLAHRPAARWAAHLAYQDQAEGGAFLLVGVIVISGSQVEAADEDGTFHVGGNDWDRCCGACGMVTRRGFALQRQHDGDGSGRERCCWAAP